LASCQRCIENRNLGAKDQTWQKADNLLTQITDKLNFEDFRFLSLTELCGQLEACNNILAKLQKSTETNVRKVGKKIFESEKCYTQLFQLYAFLRRCKDPSYKQYLTDDLILCLYTLKKMRKLYDAELVIAQKYCTFTTRTADLVHSAVATLRVRYQQEVANTYNQPPVRGTDEESRRQRIIVENTVLHKHAATTSFEKCLVCLSDVATPSKECVERALATVRIGPLGSAIPVRTSIATQTDGPEPEQSGETALPEPVMDTSADSGLPLNTEEEEAAKDEGRKEDEFRQLPYHTKGCSHVFHRECLENWLIIKMRCPVCRGSIEDQGHTDSITLMP